MASGDTTARREDGTELTIQSLGIGGPSAAAVMADLADLGVSRAIRIGSCIAQNGGLERGSSLVATGFEPGRCRAALRPEQSRLMPAHGGPYPCGRGRATASFARSTSLMAARTVAAQSRWTSAQRRSRPRGEGWNRLRMRPGGRRAPGGPALERETLEEALIGLGRVPQRRLAPSLRPPAPERSRPASRALSAARSSRRSSIESSIASSREANERSLNSRRSKSELDARLRAPIAWRWATAASRRPQEPAPRRPRQGGFPRWPEPVRRTPPRRVPLCRCRRLRSTLGKLPAPGFKHACRRADGFPSWLHAKTTHSG